VRTETVEVKVPVKVPIDPRLLADCAAHYLFPQTDKLTVGQAADRLHATEDALALCANQIQLIKETQR
jgi:hypothetical protein